MRSFEQNHNAQQRGRHRPHNQNGLVHNKKGRVTPPPLCVEFALVATRCATHPAEAREGGSNEQKHSAHGDNAGNDV